MAYLTNCLIAVDQLGNTFLWGFPDETLSARAWRNDGTKWRWSIARRAIDGLFRLLGQKDHCFEAYTSERLRRQMPVELRDV